MSKDQVSCKQVKRHGQLVLVVLTLAAMILAGCTAAENSGQKEETEWVLSVNGDGVSEEELEMLGQDEEQAVYMRVLQQWGQELGLMEVLSYEDFMELLSRENEERAQKLENGEVVYGVTEYTPYQYYRVLRSEYERMIKDALINEATSEELRTYYNDNLEDYEEIGEITAELTVRSDGKIVEKTEVTLNGENYRILSEQNEELAARLENLPVGQTAMWTDDNGIEWTLLCTGREENTFEAYENVAGAVSEQWASQKLTEEMDRRIEESTIQKLR